MVEPLSAEEIVALYEADADEGLWHAALERLGRRLDAAGVALLIGHPIAESVIASAIESSEVDVLRRWLAALPAKESERESAWRKQGDLHWLLTDDAGVVGLSGAHCVARLDQDGTPLGYADLYREPGAPAFSAAAVDAWLLLAPHLGRALVLALHVAAAETSAHRCVQCTDMRGFGCLLIDQTGAVLAMNRAAGEMLDCRDGLRIAEHRLRAMRDADDEALGGRLGEVLGDAPEAGSGFASVARPSGRRPWALFMSRLNPDRSAFAPWAPRVRLLIADTERGHSVPREVLRALYGLTEAESRVAWQLANGDSLEQAAERLGIARNTLRHHLERVFAKTGVRRQSELVQRLLAPFVSIGG